MSTMGLLSWGEMSPGSRLFLYALMIAEKEPSCNIMIVSLAALLHDADDHKLFDTENIANTRDFLRRNDISERVTEEICVAINDVSFSKNRGLREPFPMEGNMDGAWTNLFSISMISCFF